MRELTSAYKFENRDYTSIIARLPAQTRHGHFGPASFDAASRTIQVCFTTGAVVQRTSQLTGTYAEELIVSPTSVRLGRLNAGAPFLRVHDDSSLSNVVGAVVPGSASIKDGKGYATVRLSKAADVAPLVARIIEGHVRGVSVGYVYHRVEKIARDGDVPLWRVVDWEPMEVSAVAVAADPGARVRARGRTERELFPCEFVN